MNKLVSRLEETLHSEQAMTALELMRTLGLLPSDWQKSVSSFSYARDQVLDILHQNPDKFFWISLPNKTHGYPAL